MGFMERLKNIRKDNQGAVNVGLLISMVVFAVIAFALYPLIGGYVDDFTNETDTENYVGEDSAGIVSMIPIFYWLAVALVVIGVALYAIKDAM
jgi:4-amino-4-deoxy-L-arabinose transferase-like glycosyltransferase